MPIQTFICERCHKEFTRNIYPSRAKHVVKYCSKECRLNGTFIERTCERCGKTFIQHNYPSRPIQHYCSKHCALYSVPLRICKHCGKEFVGYSTQQRPAPKFCSVECFNTYSKAQSLLKRQHTCEVCGKKFIGQKAKARFCSITCRTLTLITKYTPEQKEEAILLFSKYGGRKASELTGISSSYISTLAKQKGIQPNPNIRSQMFLAKPSSLETNLYKHLDSLHIMYQPQKRIGRYIVDALVNNWLIIEADGDYWHGHSRFEPLTPRQKRQQGMDHARNTYFTQKGFVTVRIWECEMSYERVHELLKIHQII